MRQFAALIILLLFTGWMSPVFATSDQAYKDYLFQYDLYRQKNASFSVARTEYFKFQTLQSQNTALVAAKDVLTARDALLRAYLLLLNEKLIENQGLGIVEKQLYQTLIQNEVTFLDKHALLTPSIGSLGDAQSVSEQLTSHYTILYAAMRQTTGALSVGQLTSLAGRYDATLRDARVIVGGSRLEFAAQKQALMDRWLLSIDDKRSLYQQKIDTVIKAASLLKGSNPADIDTLYGAIRKDLGEAKQYLTEGTSYLGELLGVLRYID